MTVLVYILFHLRLGEDMGRTLSGTLYQVLLTAPYALGFTYITVFLFKKMSGAKRLPWDRFVRIFCTIGILFAFFFALYEYAGGEQPMATNVSGSFSYDSRKVRLYWARACSVDPAPFPGW